MSTEVGEVHQALAAVVSLGVTAILVWLTSQYVRLTRQLAEGSANQADLLAKQTEHLRLAELELRKRHAAALKELCRRIRVSTRHLDPKRPNGPASKAFSYVRDSDVAVFWAQAADVSVKAASAAGLIVLALRTVVDQIELTQASNSWQPSPQQVKDWEGALEVIASDIPKIESACDDVLSSKSQIANAT